MLCMLHSNPYYFSFQGEDGMKERQMLQKEIEHLSHSCEQLQLQLQKGQHDHVTSNVAIMPPPRATQDQVSLQAGKQFPMMKCNL